VCSRLGLQLGFKVLESGRYCLAWPKGDGEKQHPLTAAGEACVLDVYGKGALLTVKEVSRTGCQCRAMSGSYVWKLLGTVDPVTAHQGSCSGREAAI
jgi:hypothetical protein